jgi:hypothetical protein
MILCIGFKPIVTLSRHATVHILLMTLHSSYQAASTTANPGNPGILQRLGRVLKEKASGDFDRFFKGTVKTRERLGLVDELLTFWTLEDYETTLEELEEALIVRVVVPLEVPRLQSPLISPPSADCRLWTQDCAEDRRPCEGCHQGWQGKDFL